MSAGVTLQASSYASLLSLDEATGVVTVQDFTQAISAYEIHVQATSSPDNSIWSTNSDHLIHLTINALPEVPAVNFGPMFDSALEDQSF